MFPDVLVVTTAATGSTDGGILSPAVLPPDRAAWLARGELHPLCAAPPSRRGCGRSHRPMVPPPSASATHFPPPPPLYPTSPDLSGTRVARRDVPPAGGLVVQVAGGGLRALPAPPVPPELSQADTLRSVAFSIISGAPPASTAAMESSINLWLRFAEDFSMNPTPIDLCAFMALRCCPPPNQPLPDWLRRGVVRPGTASADIGRIKRWIKLAKRSRPLTPYELAFKRAAKSDEVRAFRRQIGANLGASKSRKLPVLVSMVVEALTRHGGLSADLPIATLRDLAAAAVGVGLGLRSSEVAMLLDGHVADSAEGFLVTILRDKRSSNFLGTTDAIVLPLLQPDLVAILRAYRERRGTVDPASPFLRRIDGSDRPLAGGSVSAAVRRLFPDVGVSGHSMRVGFATELYAAGYKPDLIMQMGRWKSLAALIYVLPSPDLLSAASRDLGSGRLAFDVYAAAAAARNAAEAATRLADDRRARLVLRGAITQRRGVVPPPATQPPQQTDAASPMRPPPPAGSRGRGQRGRRGGARGTAPPPRGATTAAQSPAAHRSPPSVQPPALQEADCAQCGDRISATDGFLCDIEGCDYVVCEACWPYGTDEPLLCRRHTRSGGPLPAGAAARARAARSREQEAACEAEGRRLLGMAR